MLSPQPVNNFKQKITETSLNKITSRAHNANNSICGVQLFNLDLASWQIQRIIFRTINNYILNKIIIEFVQD